MTMANINVFQKIWMPMSARLRMYWQYFYKCIGATVGKSLLYLPTWKSYTNSNTWLFSSSGKKLAPVKKKHEKLVP